MSAQTLNKIAEEQADWITEMGWARNLPMEDIGLIGSEVGEAINECRGDTLGTGLAEELADIVLRTLGLAHRSGIDIDHSLRNEVGVGEQCAVQAYADFLSGRDLYAVRTESPLQALSPILIPVGSAVHRLEIGLSVDEIAPHLAEIIIRTLVAANALGVDLDRAIAAKMQKNFANGSRSRIR